MLVLSRKPNESIIINDNIEVKILSVDGDQVKLGIVAPKSVEIHRKEIYKQIREQNEEALSSNMELLKNFKK
ncbi:carbon storage regulator CsrA [Caryophanon latum]|uniref:Translational regulator CsrA n=1 Tax=Caryophanon latum TaxID=33977 RepID=A0A1C0YI57_9BACL|nr:carbon storage regulator CsrA [Caryophanon latum]OCS86803.1 carbon storage regulator [Caryophanon latum]